MCEQSIAHYLELIKQLADTHTGTNVRKNQCTLLKTGRHNQVAISCINSYRISILYSIDSILAKLCYFLLQEV